MSNMLDIGSFAFGGDFENSFFLAQQLSSLRKSKSPCSLNHRERSRWLGHHFVTDGFALTEGFLASLARSQPENRQTAYVLLRRMKACLQHPTAGLKLFPKIAHRLMFSSFRATGAFDEVDDHEKALATKCDILYIGCS